MSIVTSPGKRSRWLLIVLCLAALVPARADVLPVTNGSFESPTLARDGQQATNSAEDWTIEGTAGVFVNNGAFGNQIIGADGEQMAFLNGTKSGSLAQIVAPNIQPLTFYSVTAGVGLRKDTPLKNGASLLIRLQSYDPGAEKVGRTLAIKEVLVGREQLSDEKL